MAEALGETIALPMVIGPSKAGMVNLARAIITRLVFRAGDEGVEMATKGDGFRVSGLGFFSDHLAHLVKDGVDARLLLGFELREEILESADSFVRMRRRSD